MTNFRFGRNVPPHERMPVAWYHPLVLWTAAREVLSSLDQLRNRDVRETLTLPLTVTDLSASPPPEGFWFDFIADTGDSGNASYAVAHTALAPSVPGPAGQAELPRGELLLLGGDLAYPGASAEQYKYRFIEIFEGARRDTGPALVRGRPFTVAALPQNHDWMDSASTFSRYFIRNKASAQFLGAQIPQRQTCFAVKLPGHWWVLGLDFALTHDIDRDQYEQFEALARQQIGPHDRVIMVYPEPYWTRQIGDDALPGNPKRYQRLEGLLQNRIAVRLAGDLHHYMRYSTAPDQPGSTSPGDGAAASHLVTCGCGGAFGHPTHTRTTTRPIVLREHPHPEAVPPSAGGRAITVGHDDGRHAPRSARFVRQEAAAYPARGPSRRRAWGNLLALVRPGDNWREGNWHFALMLGLLYTFNAYLNTQPFIDSFAADGFRPWWRFELADYPTALMLWLKAMTFSPLGLVINALMVLACMLMGREALEEISPKASVFWRWCFTWGTGALHAAAHLLAVFSLQFVVQLAVQRIPVIGQPGSVNSLAAIGHSTVVALAMLGLSTVVGGLIFGAYLTGMSLLGFLTNNAYSALGVQDFKGFLRFKVDASGRLHAWFIAIDRVPRRWRCNPAPQQPVWDSDDGPIVTRVQDHFVV
jgi:hypothetical protein